MSKNRIKVELTADVVGFRKSLNDATKQVKLFGKRIDESLSTFGGQRFTAVSNGFKVISAAATAAAVGGIYLFTRAMGTAVEKASEFETAAFQMQSSLAAAGREFDVGGTEAWEERIKQLSATLRVYSETDLRNASARTIDMTKRLGLSADQMQRVVEMSGDLGAGKTDLVGAVERVTAALRGEAESAEYLGLTLNENYVKAWYAASGASNKAWKDLTDLEKAQVRYQVLLEQATPFTGKAAASMDTYAGSIAVMKNDFEKLQIEIGNLFTNNSFVIESFKVLSQIFKEFGAEITGNRDKWVNLVKDGILLFVDGMGLAVESIRFFYNGWKGVQLAAHGAVIAIVTGLELVFKAFRTVNKPFDLFLTGLEKIGLIDANPLKALTDELESFGDFSIDEFKELYGEVEDTNRKFDEAKSLVEDFRKRIEDIPAEYKDASSSIEAENDQVKKDIVKIGGTWRDVTVDAAADYHRSTSQMINDTRRLQNEIRATSFPSGRPAGYAQGGNPFHGALSGYGGGDRRLIMVEDGEHVIRKEAVKKLGHGFFQRFNMLQFPEVPRFATGGAVAMPAAAAAGASINVTLNYSGSGSQGDARSMARMVVNELARMNRRSS